MTDRDKKDLERVLALLLQFARIVRNDGISWTECEDAYHNLLDIIAMLAVITGASTDSIKRHLEQMLTEEGGEE